MFQAGRVPNAARVIPNSMITTMLISCLMGLLTILTLAFSIKDLQAVLAATTHGYPFIEAYYLATDSKALATSTTVLIVFLIIGASLSTQAIAARQVFAFARDEGLPFSGIWTKMGNAGGRSIPINAFCLSLASTIVVALIDLRLVDTLHFIVTIFTSFSVTGCFLAIASVLTIRIMSPEELPDRSWSLGVLSIPLHLLSAGYLALMFVMSFFPLSFSGLNLSSMNWASVVWAFVFVFSTILYTVHARYVFKAPIWFAGRSFDELNLSRQFV
jgi:choline transport protein